MKKYLLGAYQTLDTENTVTQHEVQRMGWMLGDIFMRDVRGHIYVIAQPLIPMLRRQRQVELSVSSKSAWNLFYNYK